MQSKIEELLRRMVSNDASDLHIKAGSRPGFRIDGKIRTFEEDAPLSPEETRGLAEALMAEEQKLSFDNEGDLDFSHAVKDLARFRVNVLTQRGSVGMVIRQITDRIPSFAELRLPDVCKALSLKPRGRKGKQGNP